ncbi:hypothetical protein CW700_00400 [Candidatus Bathyarchaeota archaeon]|nr:MAG: hypothetical protein CW700_00400 [Candidatus Bathyarchaeota archaeon]
MPQKKSLKQMEKQQMLRERKAREREREAARIEKTIGRLDMPDLSSEEFLEQLRRMKVITPTQLASQLNVRVSIAKRALEELRKRRIVDLVSRSHNLKIYVMRTGPGS